MAGKRWRPRRSYGPADRSRRRRGRIGGATGLVAEATASVIGELALYAIAWGLVALAGISFAFYPRETVAVVAGVIALAIWGAVLFECSTRTRTPMPKGRLTVAAMCSLGARTHLRMRFAQRLLPQPFG